MTKSLSSFIGLTFLATVLYLVLDDLIGQISSPREEALASIASLALVVVVFWVIFDLVIKVIYRMTGVTKHLMAPAPARLSHQQANEIGKYWAAWLGTVFLTGIIYDVVFHEIRLKSAMISLAVATLVVVLAIANSRSKIGGHTKEELFK